MDYKRLFAREFKMKKNHNILVTSIGSLSADIVIKSLKLNGNRIIGTDINEKRLIPCSIQVDVFYQVPIAYDENNFLKTIIDICKKENIQFLIPLTDAEIDVFNNHRDYFDMISVKLCISNYNSIEICRDKYKTFELLKNYNFVELIDTYRLNQINSSNIIFPCVLKPYNGRSSQGVFIIEFPEQLELFKKFVKKEDYILQTKINGNIVTVDVCRDRKNGITVSMAREELIRTSNGAGLSVHVFEDKELTILTERIAKILDVEGSVNFEFIKTESGYKFLECNPRFSGGVAFSCLSGYDFVQNSFMYFSGMMIETNKLTKSQYIVKKYIELITEQ